MNAWAVNYTKRSWRNMKDRCISPTHDSYKNYGGRGIKVCERWMSFENFLADMGLRPQGLTLDRRDGNGNYCKDNCRWATQREQKSNTSRSRFIEYNGERKTFQEWAESTGLPWTTIRRRANAGWPTDKILSTERFQGVHYLNERRA